MHYHYSIALQMLHICHKLESLELETLLSVQAVSDTTPSLFE